MRVAHVGGNWNNGSNDGVRNWNLNNSSTNTNLNIVSQTLISEFKRLHLYILSTWKKLSRKRAWSSSENQNTMRLIRI